MNQTGYGFIPTPTDNAIPERAPDLLDMDADAIDPGLFGDYTPPEQAPPSFDMVNLFGEDVTEPQVPEAQNTVEEAQPASLVFPMQPEAQDPQQSQHTVEEAQPTSPALPTEPQAQQPQSTVEEARPSSLVLPTQPEVQQFQNTVEEAQPVRLVFPTQPEAQEPQSTVEETQPVNTKLPAESTEQAGESAPKKKRKIEPKTRAKTTRMPRKNCPVNNENSKVPKRVTDLKRQEQAIQKYLHKQGSLPVESRSHRGTPQPTYGPMGGQSFPHQTSLAGTSPSPQFQSEQQPQLPIMSRRPPPYASQVQSNWTPSIANPPQSQSNFQNGLQFPPRSMRGNLNTSQPPHTSQGPLFSSLNGPSPSQQVQSGQRYSLEMMSSNPETTQPQYGFQSQLTGTVPPITDPLLSQQVQSGQQLFTPALSSNTMTGSFGNPPQYYYPQPSISAGISSSQGVQPEQQLQSHMPENDEGLDRLPFMPQQQSSTAMPSQFGPSSSLGRVWDGRQRDNSWPGSNGEITGRPHESQQNPSFSLAQQVRPSSSSPGIQTGQQYSPAMQDKVPNFVPSPDQDFDNVPPYTLDIGALGADNQGGLSQSNMSQRPPLMETQLALSVPSSTPQEVPPFEPHVMGNDEERLEQSNRPQEAQPLNAQGLNQVENKQPEFPIADYNNWGQDAAQPFVWEEYFDFGDFADWRDIPNEEGMRPRDEQHAEILSNKTRFAKVVTLVLHLSRRQIQDFMEIYIREYCMWETWQEEIEKIPYSGLLEYALEKRKTVPRILYENRPQLSTDRISHEDRIKGVEFVQDLRIPGLVEELEQFTEANLLDFLRLDIEWEFIQDAIDTQQVMASVKLGWINPALITQAQASTTIQPSGPLIHPQLGSPFLGTIKKRLPHPSAEDAPAENKSQDSEEKQAAKEAADIPRHEEKQPEGPEPQDLPSDESAPGPAPLSFLIPGPLSERPLPWQRNVLRAASMRMFPQALKETGRAAVSTLIEQDRAARPPPSAYCPHGFHLFAKQKQLRGIVGLESRDFSREFSRRSMTRHKAGLAESCARQETRAPRPEMASNEGTPTREGLETQTYVVSHFGDALTFDPSDGIAPNQIQEPADGHSNLEANRPENTQQLEPPYPSFTSITQDEPAMFSTASASTLPSDQYSTPTVLTNSAPVDETTSSAQLRRMLDVNWSGFLKKKGSSTGGGPPTTRQSQASQDGDDSDLEEVDPMTMPIAIPEPDKDDDYDPNKRKTPRRTPKKATQKRGVGKPRKVTLQKELKNGQAAITSIAEQNEAQRDIVPASTTNINTPNKGSLDNTPTSGPPSSGRIKIVLKSSQRDSAPTKPHGMPSAGPSRVQTPTPTPAPNPRVHFATFAKHAEYAAESVRARFSSVADRIIQLPGKGIANQTFEEGKLYGLSSMFKKLKEKDAENVDRAEFAERAESAEYAGKAHAALAAVKQIAGVGVGVALPERPVPQTNSPEDIGQEQQNLSFKTPPKSNDLESLHDLNEELETADKPDDTDTDDEDDRYRLVVHPSKPRRITEKKLRDQAALQAHIAKTHRENAKSAIPFSDPDKHSAAQLVHVSESRKIIASPREYQIELFERAKEDNVIVVLPTGTGKTLISALLLRHHLEQEIEARAIGKPKKVAFFLVEKVALCVQQHAVLSCNLGNHPVTKFMGNTTGMVKSKEFWDKQFAENMVVVCTAEILRDCLGNGFITMSQINLLIFDEAHHTKKKHPYSRIMREHYYLSKGERPRILGMTASPVDAQTRDVKETALELERALDSKIVTISDEVLMQTMARMKQIEETVIYDTLAPSGDTETPLWGSISQLVSRNEQFKAPLEFTKEASSILGPWCADRYWQLTITDLETQRLAARTGQNFIGSLSVTNSDRATEAVRGVRKIVEAHQFGTIEPTSGALSAKVKKLHDILHHAFTVDGTKRCIVFVEKRYTACMLSDLYSQISMRIPGMVASYMIGAQSNSSTFGNTSFRDQVVTLHKFKRGDINCLFATPVAEEGIDVPDCDLVIRFDLYHSVIQYLQSKGRARQARSRYITMREEGNMKQLRMLKQATMDSQALEKFCLSLPPDRKLQDDSIDEIMEMQAERIRQQVYEVPSTGARLTFASSLEILTRFVASLPSGHYAKVEYQVQRIGSRYLADVAMPPESPINFVKGTQQRSKLLAKCSAAFETCKALIKSKHIDGNLQSTFKKTTHAMRNARLSVSPNKKADYKMRLRPDIWEERGEWTDFFSTTITINEGGVLGKEHSGNPLILLSRKPLPKLPGVPSSSATGVHRKEYDAARDQFPYLLAPSTKADSSEAQAHIDWDTVKLVKENKTLEWENAPEDFFTDKLVTDPYDGGRKLIIKGIDKSKKPSDPTPEGVPEHRSRAYRSVEQTIKQYSNSLYQKSRAKVQWRDDQPVVKAEVLPLRRNLLDKFEVDDEVNKECFVILEPLKVSPLPIDFVSITMAFPAIIHRLDSTLITLDACDLFGLDIPPNLALESLTKDSDNSEQHGHQQINFQTGMGDNYERLEFLGDCFLKMATTISIFTLMPNGDECKYHVERMLLICNQNLFNHAVDRKLYEYIRSKAFDRRTWYPDLPLKKGKAPKTTMQHNLSDKTIADVCEALIGAAYLTSKDNMDMAVKAVTRLSKSKNHKMIAFEDYYKSYKVPEWQKGVGTASQRRLPQQVKDATGYLFKSAPLVQSAFKHPSWPYESIPDYQRLEFLGDSLLDMVIVDYLYRNYPRADPQWLTEHKMAMVSNQFLGCLCVKLDLHKQLLCSTSSLLTQIRDFVAELEAVEENARKEAEEEGVPMPMDFWLKASAPPKVYADSIEALVGAMFVDSKYNFSVVEDFFTKFIRPYFVDMSLYDTFANKHPVTFLSKIMQQQIGCVDWRVTAEPVPCSAEEGMAALKETEMHAVFMVHQKIIAEHKTESGRYAKERAAKKALELFDSFGEDFAAAKKFLGCDCSVGTLDIEVDHGTAI
ncbi:hypothetical protein F53441_13227 [Fusarium austroafricanum]|uniref:Dicer-like protein 1 n=1 Tax=Fusarium austroafricanum TaxID=2364996 RepID=A0A8H4NLN4_9HYPO|nr:hypothetical protein F53441_13227 [Fusarium austroafricanum]